MRKLIIFHILLLICSFSAIAMQDVRVARVFAEEALGNSTYTSFCMDSFGFMWIGTDNGLIRFDGNHFSEYRHIEGNLESLSDNRILGLVKDNKERIWIATANGLNVYDFSKDSFQRITIPDFGEKGYIISIVADENGKITFVVAGVGIYEIEDMDCDKISTKCLTSLESLKDVNTLLAHSNGTLYAGTRSGVVYQSTNRKGWRIVTNIDSSVFDMSEEQKGSILINSINGLFRFNPLSKKLNHIKLDCDIQVNNLSEAIGGWIYLATYGQGLWKIHYDTNEAEYCSDIFSPFVNLRDSRIGAVFGSKDGSLWIGADYEGILIVPSDGNSFIYRKISNIIKDFDVPVTAMKVWKGKSIIGNSVGVLAILSPEGEILKVIKVPDGKAISSIELVDEDKALLGVLDNSVWLLDLNNGEINKLLELQDKYLSLLVCVGIDGCLYIGAYSEGLLKYEPKTGKKIWISHDIKGKKLLSPFITSLKAYDDKIWIGAFGGLACYNIAKGKFEYIDQSPYIACAVYDIVRENRNIFLIATTNGLIRYNISTKEVQKITTLDGLTDNDVRSIAIDGEGGKWIGTMRGLSYQASGDNRIISFIGGNGISERSFEGLEYYAPSDMMYARNRMGLTIFSPNAINSPVFQDSLKVTDIYIKGKRLNPMNSYGYPEVINLSYNDNSISVRISTMDFRDVSNTTFLWRFAGESEWVKLPEGTDLISLSSLPSGSYTLEFKAEEAGVESPVSSIKIRVAHPWYLSWIAKTIYIVIFLVLVWLLLIIIRKRHKERLYAKKMEYFMDMSHDMRSPLTLILGPLESLLKENLNSGMREKIRGAYRNAHKILNTVNQLLDLKRFDYGKRKLQCQKTSLDEFIGEIVEMFQPQAKGKEISLTFYSKDKWNDIWIDRNVLDRVMSNLISNALKYTHQNGTVEILLNKIKDRQLGDCAEISILDNGIGLSGINNSDIFRRYYRSDAGYHHSEDGYGLGLDICRKYITLHHGELRAENREDGVKGCVFVVSIPLNENIYNPDELIIETTDSHNEVEKEAVESFSISINSKERNSILIVEDDAGVRVALFDYLKDHYNVHTAIDGEDGYEKIISVHPDVIITDVKMPRVDGLQLLYKIKSKEEICKIPVIILSSKTELADRISGWKYGAEAYIEKPFEFKELSAIVRNLIASRKKEERSYQDNSIPEPVILPEVKGNDEALLERVNKVLEERIDEEDMNVDVLAEAVGVSRTHLYRRMKERLGISPSDYIRNIRLKKACELLKNDDLDITQISYALGFSSQSQFSTTFKRFIGLTPSEYRTKHKNDKI